MLTKHHCLIVVLPMLVFTAACPPDKVPNPTGSCEAAGTGARAGYHAPGPDAQWLPDCKNPLLREYWRVFARGPNSASTIPRPDGEELLQPACAGPAHELAEIVKRYGLCEQATSSEQVEIVNSMKPADALAVTHFLHGQLRFVADTKAMSIRPYAIPAEIIEACDLHPGRNSQALNEMCDREKDRWNSGSGVGFYYTGPGAVELAERLNELYGVR